MKTNVMKQHRELSLYNKVLFTVLILIGYRLLSHIPLPFVNVEYMKLMMDTNGALSFFNALTGGGFESMSFMALGITPYITASIVIQLMGVVIPRLGDLQKEGAVGRQMIERITLILAAVLGFLQAFVMTWGYGKQGLLSDYTWYTVLIPAVLMTVGVFVLSYAGQLITKHFFGNGISLILLTGIVSSYLSDADTLVRVLTKDQTMTMSIVLCAAALVAVLLLFAYAFYLNFCEKRIMVSYSQKISQYTGNTETSVIPLKMLSGSVVPIIFASTILSVPGFIASITGSEAKWLWLFDSGKWFSMEHIWASAGVILYCIMIIGFSYYYNHLNLNEVELAQNLKKRGGYIHGVRPGQDTAVYLKNQLKYMTFLGGLGLCIVALIPVLVTNLLGISRLAFLGTSIIITVSVLQETYKKFTAERQRGMVRRGLHRSMHGSRSVFGGSRKGR